MKNIRIDSAALRGFVGIGLIVGVVYSFGGAVHDFSTTGLNGGTALAFLSLIGMPVTFVLFGFILNLLNVIAHHE